MWVMAVVQEKRDWLVVKTEAAGVVMAVDVMETMLVVMVMAAAEEKMGLAVAETAGV